MAPHPCPPPLVTPSPPPLAVQPQRRQDSFTHINSSGPVFPTTGAADGTGSSTSYNLFADPTATPTGASYSSGGTSALPSDVFIWIFVLIASGLVLLTALYRIWRLRQLNRSMSTFFRTGPAVPPGGQSGYSFGGGVVPSSDPRHPDAHNYWQSAYPPFHYPQHPAQAARAGTRVQGEGIGAGGRRLDSGYGAGGVGGDKEDLPAYERGTLPGYGEVVGYGYSGAGTGAAPVTGQPPRVDREGWEVVEMDRLDTHPAETPAAPAAYAPAPPAPGEEHNLPAWRATTPPAIPRTNAGAAQEPHAENAEEVRPQPTGESNNPFRSLSPRPDAGNI